MLTAGRLRAILPMDRIVGGGLAALCVRYSNRCANRDNVSVYGRSCGEAHYLVRVLRSKMVRNAPIATVLLNSLPLRNTCV